MRYIFCLFLLTACDPQQPPVKSFQGVIMTIPFHIQAGMAKEEDLLLEIVQNTFAEVDQIYNKWNPHSEVSKLNQNASVDPIPISRELQSLLTAADHLVRITQGRFDPTVEPISRIWRKALKEGDEPQLNAEMAQWVGWDKVHFDAETYWKDHPKVELDLSGVAKGYAVDLIFTRLQKAGFHDLYVEWGGEIRVSKHHPSGRNWNIAILGGTTLPLASQAVATSGDYEQFWGSYFHVANPKTLSLLQKGGGRMSSVSVVASECWLADGLATAALLFDEEESLKAWIADLKKGYPELQFYAYD